jgi:hypothetical protein
MKWNTLLLTGLVASVTALEIENDDCQEEDDYCTENTSLMDIFFSMPYDEASTICKDLGATATILDTVTVSDAAVTATAILTATATETLEVTAYETGYTIDDITLTTTVTDTVFVTVFTEADVTTTANDYVTNTETVTDTVTNVVSVTDVATITSSTTSVSTLYTATTTVTSTSRYNGSGYIKKRADGPGNALSGYATSDLVSGCSCVGLSTETGTTFITATEYLPAETV